MPIAHSLTQLLTDPSPESLWRLRTDVLVEGAADGRAALEVIDVFHHYLNHLGASSAARDLSHLASKLDVLAVGAVALENVIGHAGKDDQLQHFALAALSEGLMVLASRQYVKAADVETAAVHADLAWFVYGAFWQLSLERRPELPAAERQSGLEEVAAALRDPAADSTGRLLLTVLLLELLVIVRLEPWLRPHVAIAIAQHE